MADLEIDTVVLRETGAALRLVATEFEHANARTDALADALGHRGLAERVREFARSWDDRRAEMVEGIAALADTATGVGETYETIDSELAAALRGEG
ncbi:hypothetical protein [Aquipuribacter sp. SD81]|uniref:hypothetical protein n=1 Tax=Aquipuribacter sp. SD81 TaxID=3127703 RepID=UPI003015E0CF